MYPLLEQAVSTWLNRMFLPGNNRNHNSNGLGDILHHTPRSRMIGRVQGDQLSQGTKDTSAFFLTFLSSWRMSPGQLPSKFSTSKKQTTQWGVYSFHSCCNKIPTFKTDTVSLFWRVEVMPLLKPPGKDPFSALLASGICCQSPLFLGLLLHHFNLYLHHHMMVFSLRISMTSYGVLSVSSLLWGHQKQWIKCSTYSRMTSF